MLLLQFALNQYKEPTMIQFFVFRLTRIFHPFLLRRGQVLPWPRYVSARNPQRVKTRFQRANLTCLATKGLKIPRYETDEICGLNLTIFFFCSLITLATGDETPLRVEPLSFDYRIGQPVAKSKAGLRGHEAELEPVSGRVYVHRTRIQSGVFSRGASGRSRVRGNWKIKRPLIYNF
jgi:hypothetical protein